MYMGGKSRYGAMMALLQNRLKLENTAPVDVKISGVELHKIINDDYLTNLELRTLAVNEALQTRHQRDFWRSSRNPKAQRKLDRKNRSRNGAK